MTAKKAPAKKRKAEIRFCGQEPHDAPFYYANNVRMRVSVTDIQLSFHRVIDTVDDELLAVPECTIAMSPQHAKSLLQLLERNIASYEDEMGPISIHDLDEDTSG